MTLDDETLIHLPSCPPAELKHSQRQVLSILAAEIQKKTSWGKNELLKLIAEVCAEAIDKGDS